MRIETQTKLVFTITSQNPPHDLAVKYIEAAAGRFSTSERSSLPMDQNGVDWRSTQFKITHEDPAYLRNLADAIREAMTLIGVEMSNEAKAAPPAVEGA